ncbi:MAG: circularly permuted type 2 ATP-grasp protein [Acidimicrobiales bacterium]
MSIDRRPPGDGYTNKPGQWDALRALDGSTRDPWDQLLPLIGSVDLTQRQQLAARLVAAEGAAQLLHVDRADPRTPPPLDPIPYCLDEASWQQLSAGLEQRIRLADAVAHDLYGPRQLLHDAVIPAEMVLGDPRYARACRAITTHGPMVALQTVDVVRDSAGGFVAVGDYVDIAAGLGHAAFNRVITSRAMPEAATAMAPMAQTEWWQRLREALSALASPDRSSPRIVVLVAGFDAVEYFEYAYLATALGYHVVQGDDLVVRGGRVLLRSFGQLEPVDVILRALPSVECDPLELAIEGWGMGVPGLAMAAREGGVALANALGTAIGDHVGLAAYERQICERLLDESLLLPTAASYWLGDVAQCAYALAHLDALDVYCVNDDASVTITRGSRTSQEGATALADAIRRNPHRFSAREVVASATTPALINRSLVPVEVVIRTAVVNSRDGVAVLPGGVARARNASVTKDVWVVAQESLPATRARPIALPQVDLRGSLPTRSAESLFWLGRHAERTEMIARTTNSIATRVETDGRHGAPEWLPVALAGLRRVARSARTSRDPEPDDAPADLWSVFTEGVSSLGVSLSGLVGSARSARAFLSQTAWRVIARVENARIALDGVADQEHMFVLTESLDDLLLDLSALAGASMESVVRGPGWMFWDLGRRVDRALLTLGLIEETLIPTDDIAPVAEVVLASCESLIAYRRRYRSDLRVDALLDLVVFDSTNPRSVAFQLDRIRDHHATLPQQYPEMTAHILQAAEALADGMVRGVPVTELVIETRGPLLRYVDALGATWFSPVDVPGVLGVRS